MQVLVLVGIIATVAGTVAAERAAEREALFDERTVLQNQLRRARSAPPLEPALTLRDAVAVPLTVVAAF